jgi:hypothetical protein
VLRVGIFVLHAEARMAEPFLLLGHDRSDGRFGRSGSTCGALSRLFSIVAGPGAGPRLVADRCGWPSLTGMSAVTKIKKIKKTRTLTAAELGCIRGGGELATATTDDEEKPAKNAFALLSLSAGVP